MKDGRSFVGIDLGTTYTSLCQLSDLSQVETAVEPVPNSEGDLLTPSAVYFSKSEGAIVGRRAERLGYQDPRRFVAQAKRKMGSLSPVAEIDGIPYTPVDISSLILRKVIADASRTIGPITDAVITVPAHFNAHQRMQTIAAGKQAGLENVGIVSEPVAAALSFVLGDGYEQLYLLGNDFQRTLLIYDLGGGTFDLSLVRFDSQQLRVLAATGDLELGGIDFDQVLVDMFAKTMRTVVGGFDVYKPENIDDLRRLMVRVVGAKEKLTDAENGVVSFRFGDSFEYDLTESEFENASAHLLDRTQTLTKELLSASGTRWHDIDILVPVGGATRMPMINRQISSFSQYGPDILRLQPDLAVAKGAALFAAMSSEEGSELVGAGQMRDIIRTYKASNVNSHPLGILVWDDKGRLNCKELIPRNSSLPVSTSIRVKTVRENQRVIAVKIVESDAWNGNGQEILCRCEIQHLPQNLPKGTVFEVDLMYDADGLLQVIACHKETGRSASISTIYS